MVETKEPVPVPVPVAVPIDNNDVKLKNFIIFAENKQKVTSQHFRGGKVNAVFGGATIDLRNAKLAPGKVYLGVNAIFGGVKVIVPSNWDVQVENTITLFGSFSDKRYIENVDDKNPNPSSTLVISSGTVFGSGEVLVKRG
jgi:predicted membrane protein